MAPPAAIVTSWTVGREWAMRGETILEVGKVEYFGEKLEKTKKL